MTTEELRERVEIISQKAKSSQGENPWFAYETAKKEMNNLMRGDPAAYRFGVSHLAKVMGL